MYTVSQLFIYPIKSLGGFQVPSAQLTDRGFKHDRRWMLVDEQNQFLTQREYPVMCLLQTSIENNMLKVLDKRDTADYIYVPLVYEVTPTINVKVWDDECQAQEVNEEANKWFSHKLAMPCRLVYMPDISKRRVDERFAKEQEITAFSDGYPLLIIGQASLDDLNSRLPQPLPVDRFRPNIVYTGGTPYAEDSMAHFKINNINFYGVKLCARCNVTTINQQNASKSKEPLKSLAAFRQKNNKIYFGQNLLFHQTGTITAGDAIEVVQTKAALFS